MMIRIPALLSPGQVAHMRDVLARAAWVDGKVTAGQQSAVAKRNMQVPEESAEAREVGTVVLQALGRNEFE